MCVCNRCWLATLVVSAVVLLSQAQGLPLQSSPNPNQVEIPEPSKAETFTNEQLDTLSAVQYSDPGKENTSADQGNKDKEAEISKTPGLSAAANAVEQPSHIQVDEKRSQQREPPPSQDAVQNVSVVDMIKPVATPSSVEPETVSTPRTSKTGEQVPQINVSVSKTINPVAAFSKDSTSDTVVTMKEVNSENQQPVKEAKVDVAVTPSVQSEVPLIQTATSLNQALPPQNQEHDKTLPHTEQYRSQPLTTVITPVHVIDVQPVEKQTISNTNTNAIVDQNSPLKKESAITLETDGLVPNVSTKSSTQHAAFTITPKEFAKKTANTLAQKADEKGLAIASNYVETDNPSHQDIQTENVLINAPKPDKVKPHKYPTEDLKTLEGSEENARPSNTHDEIQSEKETQQSVGHSKDVDLVSVDTLASNIINNLKKITDEAGKAWEHIRNRVSWLGEAAEVLQMYNKHITETKDYIRCETHDQEKYEESKKNVKNIKDRCENSLKKKERHDLENKVKERTDLVNKLVEDYKAQICKISEDHIYDSKRLENEQNTRKKLQDFDSKSFEQFLIDLKDKSLKIDEEEYEKCIDKEETKKEGEAIISEIRSAIMKIYKCV
ncbi:nucleoprotein TPR-like [Macrosteles quadrilineatus]|uniref:nucleoprotein TPR-like n=1 Tax=Macrosteles quadrilineatus TaxID=74068 RepID=UPI0023E27320|nr:nucleoprotein TPR-like [Macrosteles quadrilineatus]